MKHKLFSKVLSGFTVFNIILAQVLLAGVFILPNTALAADTGFFAPNQTIASSGVTKPDNGWDSDDDWATFNNNSDTAQYGFSDLGIPAGATIDGIEVTVEGYRTNNRNLTVALWNTSNSNPDAYTTVQTATLSGSDTVQTLGGSTSKWGKTWTVADFADTTFKIQVGATGGSGKAFLDQLQVKVYYTIPAYCGDNNVDPGEACELPGTIDCLYCQQSTSQCDGNKTQTRDASGDCDGNCGCVEDIWSDAVCVKDSCGASCAEDTDCDDYNENTTDTCDLNDCSCSNIMICTDNDQDGYFSDCGDSIDCDDSNAAVYPGAEEVCDDIDNNCDDAVDEGDVCVPEEGTISAYKWHDLNEDGYRDEGEDPIADWEICLEFAYDYSEGLAEDFWYNLYGDVISCQTTDAEGYVSWQVSLADADYYLYEIGEEGWHQTYPEDSDDGYGYYLVEVSYEGDIYYYENENYDYEVDEARFGNVQEDTTPPVVTITNKPAEFINTTDTTIEFIVDDESAVVTCKLDDEDFASCNSPKNLLDLAEELHNFTVRATDPAGNYGEDFASFTVDQTAPSLDINDQITSDTTPQITGTTTDNSADVLVTINSESYTAILGELEFWFADVVNTLSDGIYGIYAESTDAAGNTGSADGQLTIDTEAPNLTLDTPIPHSNTGNVEISGTADFGATITVIIGDTQYPNPDPENPGEPIAVSEGGSWILNIDSLDEDIYNVLARATDEAGNVAEQSAELIVDMTPPEIILNGDAEMEISAGADFIDPGATAWDEIDGELTNIEISGTVNTLVPDIYEISYDVSDLAGNTAETQYRTVEVIDDTKPVITLIGDETMNIVVDQGFEDPGATAYDNVDGDITEYISTISTVNTSQAGTYQINYNVNDAADNPAEEVIRTVIVSEVDTTAPTVTTLGTGTSYYQLPLLREDPILFGATLIFSEELSDDGKTAVENSLIAGADKTLTYRWGSGEISNKLRISIAESETAIFVHDVVANVSDVAGNTAELLLINSLADTQTIPVTTEDGSGIATVDSTTPEVVITDPDQPVTVTISSGTTNPTINVGSFITNGTGIVPQITIESDDATVTIPANTTITSEDATWNGVIAAPTVTTVTLPETSGETKTLSTAIEVGFTGVKLSFDKAVRILLPGQAGKRAGYIRTGIDFTEITNTCAADDQTTGDALAAVDGDCKIDVGSDLVIWTKHFTQFATYTVSQNQSSGDSGSSSGGGGGGGTPLPLELKISNETAGLVTETEATITWTTSYTATSQIIYAAEGEIHTLDLNDYKGTPPKYGYSRTTPEYDEVPKVKNHSVTITDLTPGTTYYYRTVSHGSLAVGEEHTFATLTTLEEEPQIIPSVEMGGGEIIEGNVGIGETIEETTEETVEETTEAEETMSVLETILEEVELSVIEQEVVVYELTPEQEKLLSGNLNLVSALLIASKEISQSKLFSTIVIVLIVIFCSSMTRGVYLRLKWRRKKLSNFSRGKSLK